MDGLEHRIKQLEKAIVDANSWLEAGEGVGLLYYSYNYDEDSQEVIREILAKE